MKKQNQFSLTKEETFSFYKKLLFLVIPMGLQNLINVGVSTSDVIMLGKLGEVELSAASLAGQIQFIMTLIFFGITSGSAVLTAQYWGKREKNAIEKILAMAITIAFSIAILFTLAAFIFPKELMHIFTKDFMVIKSGASYLRIVAFSYCAMAVTISYLNIMRSVERVLISTIVYFSSLMLNIILNAILIFGLLGAPALGIKGAAIATLCARLFEMVLVFCYAHLKNNEIRIRFRYLFSFDPILFQDFLKYSLPVVLNELLWGSGCSTNTAIIGHLGNPMVAANSVAQVLRQLAMIIVFGLANATAIMIGKMIGEGKYRHAEEYAKKLIYLSIAFGAVGGITILLSRPLVVENLNLSTLAGHNLYLMLIVMSYFTFAQAFNSVMVVGIFRAGGDTKFGLLLDAGTMWGGSILCGWIAAFLLKLPPLWVYVILMSDEILKIPLCFYRYHTKKWLQNVTR